MIYRNKNSMIKIISLVLTLIIAFSLEFVVIALDNAKSTHELCLQSFELNPEDGVIVTLSGIMPEGGSAEAVPADYTAKEDENVIHAYDITIFDAEKREFEPEEDNPVSVSIKSDAVEKAINDGSELEITHVKDNGDTESIELEHAEDNEAVFEAESFSVYVISEHGDETVETPRHIYHFLSDQYTLVHDPNNPNDDYYTSKLYEFPNKANEMVTDQIIKDGEKLQKVIIPDQGGNGHFRGWYVMEYDEEKTSQLRASGTIASDEYAYNWGPDPQLIDFTKNIEVEEDKEIYLCPLFTHYRLVNFHEGDPDLEGEGEYVKEVIKTKLVALNQANKAYVDVADVQVVPPQDNLGLFKWKYIPMGSTSYSYVDIDGRFEISASGTDQDTATPIDVYPVYKEKYWIHFSASGGAYTPSSRYFKEDPIQSLPVTERAGYKFGGWFAGTKNPDGTVKSDFTEDLRVTRSDGHVIDPQNEVGDDTASQTLPGGSYISSGFLYMMSDLELVASWVAEDTANYKIVVWMQKVSDNVDALDSEKTYDYYQTYAQDKDGNILSGASNSDLSQTSEFAYYSNLTTHEADDFKGFEFNSDATSYVSDGNTTKNPSLNPNGSSIINLYYDRKKIKVTFVPPDATETYTVDSNGEYIKVGNSYYSISSAGIYQYSNGEPVYFTSSGSSIYTDTVYIDTNGTELSGKVIDESIDYYYREFEWVKEGGRWKQVYNYYKLTKHNLSTRYSISYSSTIASFTGLYGQSMSEAFSTGVLATDYAGYVWTDISSSPIYTQVLTSIAEYPEKDLVFRGAKRGTNKTIYYYFENLPGNNEGRSYDGKIYTLGKTIKHGYNFLTFAEEFHPYTGFKTDKSSASPEFGSNNQASIGTNNTNYLYYQRNTYDIRVIGAQGGEDYIDYTGIYYQQNIHDFLDGKGFFESDPELDHYEFKGWYKDRAYSQKFDFDTEMPAANVRIYAKWEPKFYLVQIDPNGGVMDHSGLFTGIATGTSTYTWVEYGKTIGEYTNLVCDYRYTGTGDYSYINIKYTDPDTGDKDNYLPADLRCAFYVRTSEREATYNQIKNEYIKIKSGHDEPTDDDISEWGTKFETILPYSEGDHSFLKTCVKSGYSPLNPATESYVMYGWHEVDEFGTIEERTYDFTTPVQKPVDLILSWRFSGEYAIKYDYNLTQFGDNYESKYYWSPAAPGAGAESYNEGSNAIITSAPVGEHDSNPGQGYPEGYSFKGWERLNADGTASGVFFDPGESYVVSANHADNSGVITMMARYEKISSSTRRTDIAELVLDADYDRDGRMLKRDLTTDDSAKIYADVANNQIHFQNQLNNEKIELIDYFDNFSNTKGYLLLGWDVTQPPNMIPQFAADAYIGISKTLLGEKDNILYATWEPMYYLTLNNHTSQEISFTLTINDAGAGDSIYSGNTNAVLSKFERKVFGEDDDRVEKTGTGVYTVTLTAGDSIKLVTPEGSNASYTVSGSNTYKKNLFIHNSGGDSEVISYKSVQSGWSSVYKYFNLAGTETANYTVSGNMILSEEGQNVTFTEEDPKVTVTLEDYYYDVNNDTWVKGATDTGPMAQVSFPIKPVDSTISAGSDSAEMKTISGNDNKFSIKVASNGQETFTSDIYKFIGWYDLDQISTVTDEVRTISVPPNTVDLNGKTEVSAADQQIDDLIVPNTNKTYAALFVPYSQGSLNVTYKEKSDTAGHAQSLGMSIVHNDRSYSISTDSSGFPYAEVDLVETDLTGKYNITLTATPQTGAAFSTHYQNGIKVSPSETTTDGGVSTLALEKNASDLLADSDKVKGLKNVNNTSIDFTVNFSQLYEIHYNYTNREGTEQTYIVKGSMDTYNSKSYLNKVISNQPYESNFGSDISFKIDEADIDRQYKSDTKSEGGSKIINIDSENTEKPNRYTVTRIDETGSEMKIYEGVPEGGYVEDGTAHLVPVAEETDGKGNNFLYWNVYNASTGAFIVRSYYPNFRLRVWNDYKIQAVYASESGSDTYTTIEHRGDTRNQWTEGDIYYDKLISDFNLTFMHNNTELNSLSSQELEGYKVGIIYAKNDETFNTEARVKKLVKSFKIPENTFSKGGSYKSNGETVYFYTVMNLSYGAANNSEGYLSNYNRIEFFRAINNNKKGEELIDKEYMVYSFMMVPDDNENVYLSSNPVTLDLNALAVMGSFS